MPSKLLVIAATVFMFLYAAPSAHASYVQQGAKLVGTDAGFAANQGWSVAVSADGNTIIVGGMGDNGSVGAAWVYTRSGGVWSQQGAKLVGTGAVGNPEQGVSVALSVDGNTAIVGGQADNGFAGAAWVYTRSGGVWSQQGAKLVGTGAAGSADQGGAVALSEDGNTAVVGGPGDNGGVGAAWVYTRSGGVWTQQGSKLVGTGAGPLGVANQGNSVAVSGGGGAVVVGGWNDNNGAGAAWVYTLGGGVWSQQGDKLVGTGAVGNANQGIGVSVSADGNTAVVGGRADNGSAGAAWVYTRSGGVWSQQGAKLVGTGAVGDAQQGISVAMSAGGNTAIVGGWKDNGGAGAAWVYTRSGGVWSQLGDKLVGTGAVGNAQQGLSVSVSLINETAVVGGYNDGGSSDLNGTGAAWVFVNSSPTSVNDQASLDFALERVRPNPARASDLNVQFALPTAAAARLELLDISGRLVASREVGSLGAGRHSVNLTEGRKIAPGLYWVRLAQGANWRGTRVAVIE
jgi:hypothetical protein